jgi:hypothetical protein
MGERARGSYLHAPFPLQCNDVSTNIAAAGQYVTPHGRFIMTLGPETKKRSRVDFIIGRCTPGLTMLKDLQTSPLGNQRCSDVSVAVGQFRIRCGSWELEELTGESSFVRQIFSYNKERISYLMRMELRCPGKELRCPGERVAIRIDECSAIGPGRLWLLRRSSVEGQIDRPLQAEGRVVSGIHDTH